MKKSILPIPYFLIIILFITHQKSEAQISEEMYSNLEWSFVGPTRGGRSTAIAGIPSKPYTFFMGTTGGGVWKTTDAGLNWKNVSDGEITVGSIGSIAVAPSDPSIVYVGTGSADPRGNISAGNGIYKSLDHGETWKFSGLPKAGQIGVIKIHPKKSNIVYAAVLGNIFGQNSERGVYKTTNGGDTWKKIHFISNKTGARDIEINPSNSRELLASFWTVQRKPWTLIDGGNEGGIFLSKDEGKTWKKLHKGLPKGLVGKIEVEYSPVNNKRIWAMIQAKEEEEGGLYRSDDGGASWKRINRDHKIRQRGWYYSHITADPKNENTIYASNTGFYKSIDGGKTFDKRIKTPHGDNHGVWINPNNTKIMINCNDGGANVSLNGGKTWSTQLNQPTSEFYRLTVDNQFPFRMYAGQQDNSTISIPSRDIGGLTPFENWFSAGGVECSDIAVDPIDPNIIYATGYSGEFTYKNLGNGEERQTTAYVHLTEGTKQIDLNFRFQWNYPVFISKYKTDEVYIGSNVVHKTTDRGNSWSVISEDLTRKLLLNDKEKADIPGGPIQHDATGVEVYSSIFALEESPLKEGEIWTGSDDGLIHVTKNGGKTWENITPNDIIPFQGTINKIELSSHQPGRALVAVYNYRNNDFRPYIILTDDYGKHWNLLTDGKNGIPKNHFVRSVAEDPSKKGLIYAGTEFGAYISFNNGKSWNSLQLNLPHVPITDMEVTQNDLAISTQGRGFWILDKINILQQINQLSSNKNSIYLFTPEIAYRSNLNDGGWGYNEGADGLNNTISFYLKEDSNTEDISLVIKDQKDSIIVDLEYEFEEEDTIKAGIHEVYWDLEHDYPNLQEDFVSMYYRASNPSGPKAIPGEYKIELVVGKETTSKPFILKIDPRWKHLTLADFQAQLDAANKVIDLIDESQNTLEEMRSIKKQISDLIELTEEKEFYEKLKDLGTNVIEKITLIEDELYQKKIETSQDEINYPRKWTNHITHLYDRIIEGDSKPNSGMQERWKELNENYLKIIAPYKEILDEDLNNLLQFLSENKVDRIILD